MLVALLMQAPSRRLLVEVHYFPQQSEIQDCYQHAQVSHHCLHPGSEWER